jgi:hypothetical protein
MAMRAYLKGSVIAAGVLTLCACASTRINSSWKAPDARPMTLAPGDKVVAMIVSPNEATRRAAEAALATELDKRGLKGIPAYTLIPTEEIKDKDKAKARIEEAGAAAVVVMRVTNAKQEISASGPMYVGPSYGGFWGGYYGYGWGAAYSPGYLRTDTIVYIETLVYDLKQDKLIWAGQSDTMNPTSAESLVKELAQVSVAEMKKQGVIAAQK